jgi:phage tail-like protein
VSGRRGLIGDLPSPHPLGSFLPSVYLEERPGKIEERPGKNEERPKNDFPSGAFTIDIGYRALLRAGIQDQDPREHLRGLWVLVVDEAAENGAPRNVALAREGRAFSTGTMAVQGKGLTFRTSDCQGIEGRYRWDFHGDLLELAAIEDGCGTRRFILTSGRWRWESFVMRFLRAFDESLAPVFASLDNLDAYVDPHLAPHDFVDWLSAWVGLAPNHAWPLGRRRERIAGAVQLALSWGTADGIRNVVSIFAGVDRDKVEIVENGAVAISRTPGAELPGTPEPRLTVRVSVPDPGTFDAPRLRRVVSAAKPAHMLHEVEVVASESSAP